MTPRLLRETAAATALAALPVLAAPIAAAQSDVDAPRAVATVGMVADVAARVAGECARVDTMMGPGIDPHLYQPTASDVRDLVAADLLLYVGNNLEGQLGAVLARLEGQKPAIPVSERAIPDDRLIHSEDEDYADPHVWMDVSLWALTVPVLADALAEITPDCADGIGTRAKAYGEALDALHDWVGESVASVPAEARLLVTAHDAFAYYGRAYGIEVVGIQGVSTEAEAGIGDIRAVVDLVVSRSVPALFVESTINPRTVEAVIAAAADRGHALRLGGELFSDAMGEPGTPGGSYAGMIVENTRAVVDALGGTPAALPEPVAAELDRASQG